LSNELKALSTEGKTFEVFKTSKVSKRAKIPMLERLSTEAQINRYFGEESPRLLSLSKQEDLGDFSKFKISENLCFSTYKRISKES
jgi:hypothetical protein